MIALLSLFTLIAIDTVRHLPGTSWEWLALACLLSPMFSPLAWTHYQMFLAPMFLLLAYQIRGRASPALWIGLGAALILAELIWRPLGTVTALLPGSASQSLQSMLGLMTLSMVSQYLVLVVALVWFGERKVAVLAANRMEVEDWLVERTVSRSPPPSRGSTPSRGRARAYPQAVGRAHSPGLTSAVVVSRELPEQPNQMALVDHDDVVRAVPAENPHQSLGDRIRLRPELGSTFAPLQPRRALAPAPRSVACS